MDEDIKFHLTWISAFIILFGVIVLVMYAKEKHDPPEPEISYVYSDDDYDDGYDEGCAHGYDEGYEIGYDEGYDQGYQQGREDALDEVYEKGFRG